MRTESGGLHSLLMLNFYHRLLSFLVLATKPRRPPTGLVTDPMRFRSAKLFDRAPTHPTAPSLPSGPIISCAPVRPSSLLGVCAGVS
jgi:hypothetical protein